MDKTQNNTNLIGGALNNNDANRLNFLSNSFENFSSEIFPNFSNFDFNEFEKLFNLTNGTLTDPNSSERDAISIIVPITVFYFIIFIAGLLGNVITCTVISRNKCMHTATNYYLFNLAISDLLLLLSGMPPDLYNIWFPASYPFSHSICVVQGLLSETSANATVLTITSFTVERYIAICHPFRQHTMSKLSRAIKFIMAIWILAFCLAAPQAFQFTVINYHGGRLCTVERSEKDAFFAHAFEVSGFVFFVGPMTVICVLYVLIGLKLRKSKLLQGVKQQKRCEFGRNVSGQTRVIRMLVAVAVAFFLCWAPFHAQRLMAVYGSMQKENSEIFSAIYSVLTYVSGVLYFLSTCINPLLYSIMSHKFRDAFKSTISQHCGFNTKYQPNNSHTYSALSRYGGSLKMTQTMNRIQIPDLGNGQLDRNETNGNKIPIHQPLKKSQSLKNGCVKTNPREYHRCNSVSSQSTIFTSLSRNDGLDNSINTDLVIKNDTTNLKNCNNNNSLSKGQVQPASTLTTIAEKLRRNTKKVLLFKTTSASATSSLGDVCGVSSGCVGGGESSGIQEDDGSSMNHLNIIQTNDDKKDHSVESAHTNTISNSSLQELDEDEFTSSELARYMGEVNNEIRQDRNL